ncbi:MAG: MopE-related protein [Myxococcota bacterium]
MLVILLVNACVGEGGKESGAPSPEDTGTPDVPCDADGDGVCVDDCDDADASRYPGAPEECDGVDDDCDEEVDEGVTIELYGDSDGDGYGAGEAVSGCTGSSGYVEVAGDCDDGDAAVSPAAAEVCNEVDDDCDGQTDEDVGAWYYDDADGDGWGDPDAPVWACAEEPGTAANDGDCDDADAGEPVMVYDGDSIQAGIDLARLCVYVATGDYPEDLDLVGKDLIVWGYDGADVTVVTGTGDGPVLTVAAGESPWISGFTLTGGTGEPDADGRIRGGGIYADAGATPSFEDLVVRANTADAGGGVFVGETAVVELSCSEIVDNEATEGGGVATAGMLTLEGVVIARNVAETGAGTSAEGRSAMLSLTFATLADNDGEGSVWTGDEAATAILAGIVAGNDVGSCLDGEANGSISVVSSDVWGCDAGLYGQFADLTGTSGNVSVDPQFADPGAGDYSLTGVGPCRDAFGDGSGVDMGATGASCD